MKTTLIILVSALVLLVITQAFAMRSTKKTEERSFDVISKDSNFEIRYYPVAVMATVQLSGKTYREVANPGFRKLANYIFGGNNAGKGISMTAPVQMSINDTASNMSFVMPSSMTLENLPAPNDKSVHLHEAASEYVAVLEFGGYASDSKICLLYTSPSPRD